MDADALFQERFPIEAAGGAVRLEYAGTANVSYQPAVVLRLVVGEEVREDSVPFDAYAFGTDDRLAAFLTALSRVLGTTAASFATCKPSDLFHPFVATSDATTVEEFETMLREPPCLGWLVAGSEPPSVALARLDELCREIFPMRADDGIASLEYVHLTLVGLSLRIVLRLVVWDRDPATSSMSIRDIKEQEVYFGSLDSHEPTRTRALLEGMCRVLARALMSPKLETLMPHELFRSDVMKLKTAVTADDFAKALSARSRLGKLLAANEAAAPTAPLLTAEDLTTVCADTFPMRTADGAATLAFVEATSDGTSLRIVLRLESSLDGSNKEESCGLMLAGAYDRSRVHAWFAGMRTTFAALATSKLARAQPSDLLVAELLAKPNMTTEAEFAKALRTKARLGRFLA